MPDAPALELQGLSLDYRLGRRSVRALDDVSFTVGRGEIVALVGESGSGKSTIANAATGLLPSGARVASGRLLVDGADVTRAPESRWSRIRGRRVGLVPQDPGSSLTPVLTIGAQVAEIFAIRGERLSRAERRARSIELLEIAEVSRAADRLTQYPHELSGGLKQRILIAIAFGLDPALLVADEPTSALDVTVQKQILRVLDRLAAEHGTSVLFVTHDLALATDHASRALVLQRGRLVEDAPVERIVRTPATDYTRDLIAHARATQIAPPPTPSSSVPSTVLEVSGLSKSFPGRRGGASVAAVDDVSFALPAGRTLALVGESGSGKSTTARMVLRLLDPSAGSIALDGRDVTAVAGRDRLALWRTVQLVYQNPDSALDPRWNVGRIVSEPLLGSASPRERRARVEELLDAVSLPDGVIDKRPGELSGGQRQRVAIARALAPHSSLVVLDEALSALDVITQERVLQLLERLQREQGVSYLFISHDLSTVRRLAHDVVVLRAGRVVEQGPSHEIFAAPRTDYVRELLDAVPGRRLLADPATTPTAEDPR
ncbi:ABC transporter ATP-binding protein [Rathayibacter sp. Leaf299]|uniref:dipeptide ABC transporter ATP-binding protein n=1 Tax=unclassified Rathayibacter TaxID=2609250 RepID=UPI0006FE46BD|nr:MULTISPECIES: ABC transporter ATP-binding protein [unclassified Rathayibacter]KQQ18945.1 ABC transporter ATP-binding protein [Rathayibacter sp. Leaf299]